MQHRQGGLFGDVLENPMTPAEERQFQAAVEAWAFFPEIATLEDAVKFFGAIPSEKIGQLYVPESRAFN